MPYESNKGFVRLNDLSGLDGARKPQDEGAALSALLFQAISEGDVRSIRSHQPSYTSVVDLQRLVIISGARFSRAVSKSYDRSHEISQLSSDKMLKMTPLIWCLFAPLSDKKDILLETINALLDVGADKSARDQMGLSAYDHACKLSESYEIVARLEPLVRRFDFCRRGL